MQRRGERSAFTLVEIMVVIVIIGSMAVTGALVITPQISYFRSRRDAENLLISLRRARSTAMSRGAANGNYGVTIFRGSLDTMRTSINAYDATLGTPWCFIECSDPDTVMDNNDRDRNEISRPSLSIGLQQALDESELLPQAVGTTAGRISIRPLIVNLHEETTIHGAGDVAISSNTVIQFDSKGKLQTDNGKVSSLIAEPVGSPNAYSMDIQNPNMGYYRIRIRVNGTVEISACCETGVAPYVMDASGNQSAF